MILDGTLDSREGIYKGIDGSKVMISFGDEGVYFVPYPHISPVPPSAAKQWVYCLLDGKDFGARFEVLEYGTIECILTAYRGGHKGKDLRTVFTKDLTRVLKSLVSTSSK